MSEAKGNEHGRGQHRQRGLHGYCRRGRRSVYAVPLVHAVHLALCATADSGSHRKADDTRGS